MEILFIDDCPSTHLYLCDGVKSGEIKPPFAICAKRQNAGVGSRGNKWQGLEGNLFLSFCLAKDEMADDIPDASISIYFSMLMRNLLHEFGSKLWVKWPNDFYLNERKIGGTISTKIGQIYIGSIGLNLVVAPKNAGILDIKVSPECVATDFVNELSKKNSWKHIFSKFQVEFERSKNHITHIGPQSVNLSDAQLCDDGAILIDNKKVYSLR
ncbi:biotin--[acetyl-CoA-carboxylase] ligase [Campylobacter anatolicus]|uniref:biotin--[acetyl-CoA-carboxylase] ligase n=1 Tax=Campylobacter anatolicus TaxID=2829105 RepID=UPI001E2C8646|nr:biotin--[acetyl-CoA-carboxylase] ligase [Campylobacter anatolicus]